MPWLEIEERHEEVETVRGDRGDDEVGEDVVTDRDCVIIRVGCKLRDDDVHTGECGIHHDDGKDDHTGKVQLVGALRSVTQRHDELSRDEQNAGKSKNDEDDIGDSISEGVNTLVGKATGDEVECEVEVGEREVREEDLDELVDKLNREQDLAGESVVCGHDLAAVDE